MPTDDLLQQGISAAQAGDLAQARRLLFQVVRANPRSELGWQWLGYSLEDPVKQADCFRRALLINPKNAYARQQLDSLRALGVTPPAPAARRSTPRAPKKQNRTFLLAALGGLVLLCLAAVGTGVVLVNRSLPGRGTAAVQPVPTQDTGLQPAAPTALPTPGYAPIYGQVPCTFEIPASASVECGVVVVPEDRQGDPQDTLRLATAIFHSSSPNPAPDPVILLPGGPGLAGIPWSVQNYAALVAPLAAERDVIAFDPRGTGATMPALGCPELKSTYLGELQGQIPAGQRLSYYTGAVQVCRQQLAGAGIAVTAYNSQAYAADVRDILAVLGYGQANLYALSYGTLPAQVLLRDDPGLVRSAVLDSLVPLQAGTLAGLPAAEKQALDALFAACASDSACAAAYPDLNGKYQAAILALDDDPLRTSTASLAHEGPVNIRIDGQVFADTIAWMLRSAETLPAIPQLITRTQAGNYDPLRTALALPYAALDELDLGAYLAVNCREQAYTATTTSVSQVVNETCALWGLSAPLEAENDPARSGPPVLLLNGRFDPLTPASYARQAAASLENASLVELPARGHLPGADSDCARQLLSGFLRSPNAPPQTACLARENKIGFLLPYTGTPPLALQDVAEPDYKLLSQVPAGWHSLQPGIYLREAGFGDIVQLNILQGPANADELLETNRREFNAGAGFNSPALAAGKRRANSLDWSLYTAASGSLQVDMAFAKYGKQTLMVMLVSYPDEREALYQAVFLPVVDATKPAP